MGEIVIKVENLGKSYRLGMGASTGDLREALAAGAKRLFHGKLGRSRAEPFWALQDVSFEVARGEVFGVIGRNGAGKSTLLKILSRVTPPTTGRALVTGRMASLLEVGTGFHPELSGRENTYLNGAILGMSRRQIDAAYESIVEYAGIAAFMDTPTKRYSSGMRVRLGFAIAAHLRPEILVLDEVLAVGDVQFQRKSSQTILDYAGSGNTVLFVSHNTEAVRTICSRVLVLDGGLVSFVGSPEEAIRRYQGSLHTEATTNLLERPRQDSNLTPFIRQVRLQTAQSVPTTSVHAGDPCQVLIEVCNTSPWQQPYVELVIKDALGTRLALVSTRIQQSGVATLPAHGTLVLHLAALPFLPGNYHLAVEVGAADQRVDFLDRVGEFAIEWADVYGTGRLQPNARGPVIVRARAEVQETCRTVARF